MIPNIKATEQAAILGVIAPSSQAVGALTSGWCRWRTSTNCWP